MKTKRVLKKWVVNLIIIINFMNFVLACGEWANNVSWLGFIVYTLIVMFISYKILKIGSVIDYEIR